MVNALTSPSQSLRVLHDFFANGEYRPRSAAETYATSSPSMDISKASNFERMLFDATLRDSDLTRELFANSVKDGGFAASDLGGEEVMERIRGDEGIRPAVPQWGAQASPPGMAGSSAA